MAESGKSYFFHNTCIIIFLLLFSACGSSRSGFDNDSGAFQQGTASWYGPNFNGNPTANGERFDMRKLTAAHRTLPFNTHVKVVNLNNQKSVTVRINDRGPFAKGRIIDLSKRAAEKIDMIGSGTAPVRLFIVSGNNSTGSSSPPVNSADYANPDRGKFTIQIASYVDKDRARKKAKSLPRARVEKVRINGDKIFRVYYGTYKSKTKARKKLNRLKQKGIDGFIKSL